MSYWRPRWRVDICWTRAYRLTGSILERSVLPQLADRRRLDADPGYPELARECRALPTEAEQELLVVVVVEPVEHLAPVVMPVAARGHEAHRESGRRRVEARPAKRVHDVVHVVQLGQPHLLDAGRVPLGQP